MRKQFIDTGEVVTTHGVRGEVRVYPWSDTPDFLCGFDSFYLDAKGARRMEVERARVHKNVVVVKFKGIDTIEEAEKLRGKTLYIDRDDCELEEGEYFIQDLIGLRVLDADTGACYGEISDVSQTGANDVYHIRGEGGRERLIPAIKEVVVSTDPDAGEMRIRPLEGLFDED